MYGRKVGSCSTCKEDDQNHVSIVSQSKANGKCCHSLFQNTISDFLSQHWTNYSGWKWFPMTRLSHKRVFTISLALHKISNGMWLSFYLVSIYFVFRFGPPTTWRSQHGERFIKFLKKFYNKSNKKNRIRDMDSHSRKIHWMKINAYFPSLNFFLRDYMAVGIDTWCIPNQKSLKARLCADFENTQISTYLKHLAKIQGLR